jgi:hypothetical protein
VTAHTTRVLRAGTWLPGAAIAVLIVAGCGAAAATATPAGTVAPTPAGPTSYGAYVAHLGFGGQAGPNEVRRMARYISDHAGAEALFDLDGDIELVSRLNAWLDSHPPTACWADHHRQVRAHLAAVEDGWTRARPTVERGGLVPYDIVETTLEEADAANDLPEPVNCP